MLILHTAHTYAPEANGVAEVVGQVSTRLAQMGHEVHVATSRPRLTLATQIKEGVHVHRFAVEGDAVHGIHGDAHGYLAFVQSRQWDVVAMHYAPIWSTDLLLPRLSSLPGGRVLISHGLSIYGHPKYQPYLSELAAQLRHAEKIVSLSPLLEETPFCQRHGLPAPRIIPNGVDPAVWSRPTLDLRQRWRIGNRGWVLSVSNHSPVKNHAAFFDTLKRIRRERADVAGTIIGRPYPAAKWRLGRWGVKAGCRYRCHLRSL